MTNQKSVSYSTITHANGNLGGHTRHKELVKCITKSGAECIWMAPSAEELTGNAKVTHLKVSTSLFRVPFISHTFNSILTLYRHKKNIKDTVFLAFSEFDVIAAILCRSIFQPKKIIFLQRSDLITKTKILLSKKPSLYLRLRLMALSYLYRNFIHMADKVIVQTPHHAARLLDDYNITNVSVISNNINTSWIDSSSPTTLQEIEKFRDHTTVFGVVANIFYYIKGFDILLEAIEAASNNNDFKVFIIGNGQDYSRVAEEIKDKKIDHIVHMMGKIIPAKTIYHNFDALIVPSPFDDCPNVILEAIASNVPLIATDIEAHQHLLGEQFHYTQYSVLGLSSSISEFAASPMNNKFKLQCKEYPEIIKQHNFDWGSRITNAIIK